MVLYNCNLVRNILYSSGHRVIRYLDKKHHYFTRKYDNALDKFRIRNGGGLVILLKIHIITNKFIEGKRLIEIKGLYFYIY